MNRAPEFRIRPARWPADEAALRAVREAVFVREQGVPETLEWDGRDAECLHWLACSADGAPVGTARMTPSGHVGRMAVLAPWRHRGVGSALLRAALEAARRQGLTRVRLNAQVAAVDFYLRHGFGVEGPEFLDAGIPHRRMLAVTGPGPRSTPDR